MTEINTSIVLPSYNEEGRLRDTIEKVRQEVSELSGEFEIIIVEDGCTDSTPEIAEELSQEEKIKHLHFKQRQGKGKAIQEGFNAAEGEKLLFLDTDLSTDLEAVEKLINELESSDVVIGSRYHPDSSIKRDKTRKIASIGYNSLVKVFVGSEVDDHQCGFKGIRKGAFEDLKGEIESDHWFWDTELIVRAQRNGLKVSEISVNWEMKDDSKVNLEKDVPNFMVKIFWMKKELLKDRLNL